MGPHAKAKLRIAYRIEELLGLTYRPQPWGQGKPWDSDRVAREIAAYLPMSAIEAEEEMAELSRGEPLNRGPSLLAQLREAVHATPEMSLRTVLEAAITKLHHEVQPTHD